MPNNPEPWRSLVEALIEIARVLLPEKWARYLEIACGFERVESPEAAAHARLARPRNIWEAVDWSFLGRPRIDPTTPMSLQIAELMRARQHPPPTPIERQRIALAQEGLQLEDEFEAALIAEHQAERWEAEAVSEADGRGGKVAGATWFVAGLKIDRAQGAIIAGKAPRLLGVRTRPVARNELSPTGGELPSADDAQPAKSPNQLATDDPAPAASTPMTALPTRDEALQEMLKAGMRPGTTMPWGEFTRELLRRCGANLNAPKPRGFGERTLFRIVADELAKM